MTIISIDSGYFNAGLVIVNGTIRECAPILRWMKIKGYDKAMIEAYCKKKGWKYSKVSISVSQPI